MVKVIETSDGKKLVDEKNKFAGSIGKGIKPPKANQNNVQQKNFSVTQDLSVDSPYDSLYEKYIKQSLRGQKRWSDSNYTSPSDKADAYMNPQRTWMAHPAHQGAFQVSAWGGLKPSAPSSENESCFIHLGVYDRAVPAKDPKTGESGVVLSSGAMSVFYKDSELTSLDFRERDDVDDASTRMSKWRGKQRHDVLQDA